MKIRKYKNSDNEQIIRLLKFNTPEYFSPNEEKDLLYYLDNHAVNYYVVEIDGILVGCGGFNLEESKMMAKISWDIIHPDYQGQGIGSELLKYRVQRIKEIEGIKILSVRTSQLVYKFYERFGMKIRETVKDYWDKGFDLYRLDCEINTLRL